MPLKITLADGGSPSEQIRAQIRGLVATDRLAAGERLPSVRQLAKDLGVAPGTVAKAYRTLEQEGVLQTRIGGGTRIHPAASTTPRSVLERAHALAEASAAEGVELEDAVRILRAIWVEEAEPDAGTS